MRGYLVKKGREYDLSKDVLIFDDPSMLKPLTNKIAWEMLTKLAEKPSHIAGIARELNLYRQKAYYYAEKLERAGIIRITREDNIRGGIARIYSPVCYAFCLDISGKGETLTNMQGFIDERTRNFFHPAIEDGELKGKIVVGSPEPHGPNMTVAKDGHLAATLAFFLGGWCRCKGNPIRLDIEVRARKEEGENLIAVGGPGTNLITASVNRYLPIRFDERNYWAGLSGRGRRFSSERDGLIAKVKNPLNPSNRIIVLAGVRHLGTKAAILAITKRHDEVFEDYEGEESWARVVRGLDRDGDGDIDDVEVLL
ncbi:MAG: hypothetical protein J7K45_02745 [Thaumarchaeota archaeon]|nr:hypothetical protein [Nitrososphaerota archaeon]